ncbi:trimethylamine methyltransferase family protein [bacterium]|nr:trimethylamine methyltransferase family protein [bacterium]
MADIHVEILSEREVQAIHDATVLILRDTGIMVHHDEVLKLLAEAGAQLDHHGKIARLPEQLIMDCIALAGKQYVLHGRDRDRTARFGFGDLVLMSSPGQKAWIDSDTGELRPATMQDLRDAICLGDALPNITIVGSMAQPEEAPETYRDVVLTAELVKGTGKPTRTWVYNGRTARYVLEVYRTVAGGDAALRERPMVEAFLEPISPLQLPRDGLEVVIEFVRAGQPVSIGPMAMASGTAPTTLAGTLAQENAEILAGVVVTQLLAPGTPVTYGGIPHIMDPRTSICSFGSPEQALMAVAMVQMGRFYGFPVYINVGLTDSKVLDVQAGIEKGSTIILGALAGADMFGHAGICGTDHGAGLAWLALDDTMMAYVKRIVRGFEVNADTLATEVISAVGPTGSYLAEEHTVKHFRHELWLAGHAWTRQAWHSWETEGRNSMSDRVLEQVNHILARHNPEPMDESLAREVDRIVECAEHELG